MFGSASGGFSWKDSPNSFGLKRGPGEVAEDNEYEEEEEEEEEEYGDEYYEEQGEGEEGGNGENLEEDVAELLTQVGSTMYCVSRDGELFSSKLSPSLTSNSAPPVTWSKVRCFPNLPLMSRNTLCFSPNSRLDKILLVTASEGFLLHLSPASSRQGERREKETGCILRGSAVPCEDERGEEDAGWRVELESNSLHGAIRLRGELSKDWSRLEGTITLGKDETLSFGLEIGSERKMFPFRSGAEWVGSCQVEGISDMDLSLRVLSVSEIDEANPKKGIRLHASLGDVQISLLDPSIWREEVVGAAWHPLLVNQFVLLTAAGFLHIFDDAPQRTSSHSIGSSSPIPSKKTRNGGESRLVQTNALKMTPWQRSRTEGCRLVQAAAVYQKVVPDNLIDGYRPVSMSFGSHSACRDDIGRCSSLALMRKLCLFVLCSNGAILALTPFGHFSSPTSTPSVLKALASSVQQDIKVLTAKGDSAKEVDIGAMERILDWANGCLTNKFAPDACPFPRPFMLMPPNFWKNDNVRAVDLECFPQKNSPTVSFLVSLSNGTVMSLVGGGPLYPSHSAWSWHVPESSQKPEEAEEEQSPEGLKTPVRDRTGMRCTPTTTRDSPLKNLGEKITRAVLESKKPANPQLQDPRRRLFAGDEFQLNLDAILPHYVSPPSLASATFVLEQAKYFARVIGATSLSSDSVVLTRNRMVLNCAIAYNAMDGRLILLSLPWIDQDGSNTTFAQGKLGRLLGRQLNGVQASCPHAFTCVVEPGVGHLLMCLHNETQVASMDLGVELVNLETTLAMCLAYDRQAGEDQDSYYMLADGGQGGRGGEEDVENSDRELDDLKTLMLQHLARLVNIPKELRKIKVSDKDTPVDLRLAVCSWLRELSDGLLFGSPSSDQGLMQALMVGFQLLEKRRKEQDETLMEHQKITRELIQDFSDIRQGINKLRGQMKQWSALQHETGTGIEEAKDQLDQFKTPVDGDRSKLISELEHRIATLRESVTNCLEQDQANRGENPNKRQNQLLEEFFQSQESKHVKELQDRTSSLLERMTSEEEKCSVVNLSLKLRELQQSLSHPLITFLSLRSPSTQKLQHVLSTGGHRSLYVDNSVLNQGFQRLVRRKLELDPLMCPYMFEARGFQGSTTQIRVIVLPELFEIEENDESVFVRVVNVEDEINRTHALVSATEERSTWEEGVESVSAKETFSLVALVGFTNTADATGVEALSGLYECDERGDFERFCDLVAYHLRANISGIIRSL